MQHIDRKIQKPGLRVRKYFWDDGTFVGTPEAIAETITQRQKMQSETGLALKMSKTTAHFRSPADYEKSRHLFPGLAAGGVRVVKNFNVSYMHCPVSLDDDWVEDQLEEKSAELEKLVDAAVAMPYRHEAFSILQSCASDCRITHLLRTLPPRQTVRLTTRFDEKLREAFSHLIAIDSEPGMLNDLWWKQVKLPRKFGGMHLRSGALTGAAQYAQSRRVENCRRLIRPQDHHRARCKTSPRHHTGTTDQIRC